MFHFLLQQGAKDSWEDNDGWTPACSIVNRKGFEALAQYSYDREDVASEMRLTRLHRAAATFHQFDASEFSQMLASGFRDVNTPDRLHRTPLHWACRYGNATAADLLLQWRANVSALDNLGRSPLVDACMNDDLHCVKLLLDAGADAKQLDIYGQSPLFFCREPGIVDILVSNGTRVDQLDEYHGRTALHKAISEDNDSKVWALLKCGATQEILEQYGDNAVFHAVTHDAERSLRVLLDVAGDSQVRSQ